MEILHEIAISYKDRILLLDKDLSRHPIDLHQWAPTFYSWKGRHYHHLKQGPGWSFSKAHFPSPSPQNAPSPPQEPPTPLPKTIPTPLPTPPQKPPTPLPTPQKPPTPLPKTIPTPPSKTISPPLPRPPSKTISTPLPTPLPKTISTPLQKPPSKTIPTPLQSQKLPTSTPQKPLYDVDIPVEVRRYFQNYETLIFPERSTR